ncbi:flippase, partial [bacterium]
MNFMRLIDRLPFMRGRFDDHMKEVVAGSVVGFFWRVAGAALQFFCNVFIARLLGVSHMGAYMLAFTIAVVASTVGRLGLDQSMLRFIAVYAGRKEWDKLKGVYTRGMLLTLAVSAFITLLLLLASPWLSITIFKQKELTIPMMLMSLSIVPSALSNVISGSLQALKRIQNSTLVQVVLSPAVNIVLLWLFVSAGYGVAGAVVAYVVSAVLVFLAGALLWRLAVPELKTAPSSGAITTSALMKVSMPLAWTSVMIIFMGMAGTLILGALRTPAEVGVYSAALRLSLVPNYILIAVAAISAPKFAALYDSGDVATIERISKHSIRLMLLFSAPILIMSVFAPGIMMRLYGSGFSAGASSLVILSLGQALFIAIGLAGQLLIMTGKEVAVRNITFMAAFLNIVLCFVLIPSFGVNGAAIAHIISYTFTAIASQYVVGKHLKILLHP